MLKCKLFTASGPGIESKLVREVEIDGYRFPEIIILDDPLGRYFIPCPTPGDYREVTKDIYIV